MAANTFGRDLAEVVFSAAKRPGKYLLAFLKNKAEKEFQKIYLEQMMYQGTFLSKVCKFPELPSNLDQIKKECDEMSMHEQKIFVNCEYTEQTYKILNAMHKISRNIPIIYDPKLVSTEKYLLDPNMFPLQTAKSKDQYVHYESIWDNFKQDTNPKFMKMVGHVLDRRPSSVPHPQAGNGVWLFSDKVVPAGTLLGFYPGVHHTCESMQSSILKIYPQTELPYILRWNGDAIFHEAHLFYPPFKFGYSCEEYLERLERLQNILPIEVLPTQVNPYALGHFINHPPPQTPPNVCFIDFEISETLFPSFLMQHFPYMRQTLNPTHPPFPYTVIGIISICPLQNQELFVNYGSERFPDGYAPDWLETPPDNMPLADYLCKDNCVHEFSKTSKTLIKWDELTMTELEKMQQDLKAQRKQQLKEALEDPSLFKKYYKKDNK